MNTLEEFEKRLNNLLDFIKENKGELIYKYNLGMYFNCSYIKDGYLYDTGDSIGNPLDISLAIFIFLEKQPRFIEFLEKNIAIAKRSANGDRSKRR